MIENEVLKAIKDRRSVLRFERQPVPDDKLESVLEAGRWAPSYANAQPWTFVVVKDQEAIHALGEQIERIALARRGHVAITGQGSGDAQVIIAVVVDPDKDPHHHLEAGAVAAQNMALAAHAVGLASYWAGVYDDSGQRRSVEAQVREILGVPKRLRVVALLPIGVPAYQAKSERGQLSEFVRYDRFQA
ncbi:MAG: nitroreductase family protein [Candidatus Bipolaricaulaceae bacterium]